MPLDKIFLNLKNDYANKVCNEAAITGEEQFTDGTVIENLRIIVTRKNAVITSLCISCNSLCIGRIA